MNLPNFITLLRIIALPFFAISMWYGQLWISFGIFIGAGLSDLLDGWIARRYHLHSRIGSILDPAADKLMMVTAFVVMGIPNASIQYPIPMWIAILSISRDVIIGITSILFFMRDEYLDMQPSFWGKLTTASMFVGLSISILLNALAPQPWSGILSLVIYYILAGLVLISGIHYSLRLFKPQVGLDKDSKDA